MQMHSHVTSHLLKWHPGGIIKTSNKETAFCHAKHLKGHQQTRLEQDLNHQHFGDLTSCSWATVCEPVDSEKNYCIYLIKPFKTAWWPELSGAACSNQQRCQNRNQGWWCWGGEEAGLLNHDYNYHHIASQHITKTVIEIVIWKTNTVRSEGFFTGPHSLMWCHALLCSGWGGKQGGKGGKTFQNSFCNNVLMCTVDLSWTLQDGPFSPHTETLPTQTLTTWLLSMLFDNTKINLNLLSLTGITSTARQ